VPARPGNQLALRHGGRSQVQIKRVARTQKRRLLRQIGLRAGDLDGVALGLLDNWARAQAKVELLDLWFAEHGLIDEQGEPRAPTKIYFVAINSARLALVRLADHLKTRGATDPSMIVVLQAKARRRDTAADLPRSAKGRPDE
jgi:hypothetical protein